MANVRKIEDIIITLLLISFFGTALIRMDKWIGHFKASVPFETGPDFFPKFIVTVGLILLSCTLITQFLEFRSIARGKKIVEEGIDEPISAIFTLIAAVISTFLYIFIMKYIGFLISSVLFLSLLQIILGNRIWWRIASFSCGAILACFLVFIKLLYIQLPRGAGVFEQISLLFY